MPSWKKLITSGSAASLSSITTSGDITIPVTNKLYLDGGVDTYIQETSADLVDLYVGGQNALRVLESSDVSYAYVPDSQFLGAGTSIDFTMNHDGSNSQLTNNTGDLYIRNNDNDKDIIFQTDDGSGGITAYLTLDGSATDIKIAQHMQFADNKELRIGNDNDLRLVSNNSNTFIDNYLGSMFIRQTVDDQDIIFQCDNGSGGLATYLTLDGSTGHLNLTPPNNVGIGTDAPSTITEIKSTIPVLTLTDDQNKSWTSSDGTLGKLSFKTSDASGIGVHEIGFISLDCNLASSTTPNGELVFGTAGVNAAATEKMRIDESGNVGIGGTPVNFTNYVNLDVKTNASGGGVIGFHDSGGTRVGCISHTELINTFAVEAFNSHPMTFLTNNVEAMRIDSSQNVGIGTDSPQTKLHVVGTISGSQIESSGDVIAYSTSDRKFKDNIEPIQDSLYKVSQIGGYTFDWNDKQETYKGSDVGVIAQEIQEVLPEVVTERENGLAVKYEKIVPLLIESIKELKQEIDDIKQKCDCLNK